MNQKAQHIVNGYHGIKNNYSEPISKFKKITVELESEFDVENIPVEA